MENRLYYVKNTKVLIVNVKFTNFLFFLLFELGFQQNVKVLQHDFVCYQVNKILES